MQDIYDYLKKKLKERKVKVEDIIERSGLSRTTVYRIMKGLLKPTPEVYNLLVEILELDEREKRELDYYIRLIDVDESLVQARKELQNIIFKTSPVIATKIEDIEFIVYGKEKYIKGYSELLCLIIEVSKSTSFQMNIKIYNCVKDTYLTPLVEMLSKSEHFESSVIEQLVSFSETDSYNNIVTLKAILPLMKFNNYSVFYISGEEPSNNVFVRDLMLIKYRHDGDDSRGERYMVLSFEDNTMSGCYITEDKSLYEFYTRKYALVKEAHENSLVAQKNIGALSNAVYEFESGGKTCIIKPNPCYHRVPIDVCMSVLGRQNESQLAEMIGYLGEGSDFFYGSESVFENMLVYFVERDKLTFKYNQTDIYTVSGLEAFARERRLSDYFSFLPELTGDEVRLVLENIRRKNNDPKDKYRFYITQASLVDDSMTYCASENNGILVEYFEAHTFQNNLSDCIIKQDMLSRMLLDFAENYVPDTMALSQAEVDKFIDYLIETYCV